MKKAIIIVLVVLVTTGLGCSAKNSIVTQPVTEQLPQNQPATAQQKPAEEPIQLETLPDGQLRSSIPEKPVLFSTGTPPLALTQIAKPLSKEGYVPSGDDYGAPFRVGVGQTFIVREGCSYNPSYENHVTVKSITAKNGLWTIYFSMLGPFNKYNYVEDGEGGYRKVAVNEKPITNLFALSQDESIVFSDLKGALYGSNGAYIPVFVSKDEVYFKYVGLSC